MSEEQSSVTTARTRGAHHIGLTVSDLEGARGFFLDALGFSQVAHRPDYPAYFVSDGVTMITLWRAEHPDQATSFDRRQNVGLHHLALRVPPDSLEEVAATVAAHPGVELEFEPESLGETGLRHMVCTIPGGPRLELIGAD